MRSAQTCSGCVKQALAPFGEVLPPNVHTSEKQRKYRAFHPVYTNCTNRTKCTHYRKRDDNLNNSDKQSQKFQLTINNPIEKGLSHQKIFELARDKLKTLDYICMADEKGTTFHTHVFIYCTSRVRWSTIKTCFPDAHIEIARGNVSQNVDYITKKGKWKDTEKNGTSIEGSFDEWGVRPPDSVGRRKDMSELYIMINAGLSDAEILAQNQDYILQIDKLAKLRTLLLTEKYKEKVRLDLEVIYISGATGTGKTRYVLETHGYSNVYRVTDYDHPFDGYACQPVICFDEYRSSLRLKDMLCYMDIYPIELPARYANKYACYKKVYIVSNWSLEKQYSDLQKDDEESWQAFLRRIHKVHVYDKTGNIKVYDSVSDYMTRDEIFDPVDDEQITLPFNAD